MELKEAIEHLHGISENVTFAKPFRDALTTILEHVATSAKFKPDVLDQFMKSLRDYIGMYVDQFLHGIVFHNDDIAWAVFKTIFDRNQGEIYVEKYADKHDDEHTLGIARTAHKWLLEQLDMELLYDNIKQSIKKVVNEDG